MKHNLQPVTIKEVINEGKNTFIIPSYQRGYRWGKEEIEAFLDDVNVVRDDVKPKEMYCIQPLILMKNPKEKYKLIDGQQRLTTIFLILNVLGEEPLYKLEFQNQSRQARFTEMEKKLNGNPIDLIEDLIDMYYISNAYNIICEWFTNNVPSGKNEGLLYKLKYVEKLMNQVTVIWYEIDEDEESEKEVFQRINSGKLPLTNSELLKALIMLDEYCVKEEEIDEKLEPEIIRELRKINRERLLNKRLRIARQWDEIENTLQSEDFWLFLNKFQLGRVYDTRIDFIFDLYANKINCELDEEVAYADNTDKFPFFVIYKYMKQSKYKGEDAISDVVWGSIWNYFMMFKEWYNSNELYHLIGFLLAYVRKSSQSEITDIINLRYDNGVLIEKTRFIEKLKKRVIDKIGFADGDDIKDKGTLKDDLESLDFNVKSEKQRIFNILLLFNVISMMIDNSENASKYLFESYEQYSRFPFHRFKKERYDIEHIHAIASEEMKDKDAFIIWIKGLNDKEVNKLLKQFDTGKVDFEELYSCVLKLYSNADEGINGICNLTLLDEHTNREYKNAPFPVKKQYLMDVIKGGRRFVPICTRNIFLKAYSKKADNILHWDKADMDDYTNAIIDTIYGYLNEMGE